MSDDVKLCHLGEIFEGTEKQISGEKSFFLSLKESIFPVGRGEDALMADQFEVSECTLPGPSVGDITEDGVVASCHPPLAFKPCGLYMVFPPRASLYPAV